MCYYYKCNALQSDLQIRYADHPFTVAGFTYYTKLCFICLME